MSVRPRRPGREGPPRESEAGSTTAWPGIRSTWALAAAMLASLLLVLHGRYLLWPFVSDDIVFVDASRQPGQLFSTFHQYSNYFRPVGRELYFFAGHLLAGHHPLPYHM